MNPLESVRLALEAADKAKALYRHDRLQGYVPYPWQRQGHAARDLTGKPAKQVMILGGNRTGKTHFGASNKAIHLTGRYPAWWGGRRYSKPIKAICGGVSTTSTRDIIQEKLLGGDPENEEVFGTGWIPRECLLDKKGKPMTERWVGLPGGVQKFYVRHVSGGLSQVDLKSYEQGKGPWMGVPAEEVWLDEEPPQDIYSQSLRATVDTGGVVDLTMTPENGATDVVSQFMRNLRPGQALIKVTWDDSPHLTPEIREQLLAAFPIHEREMRSRGVPQLGQGLVFPWSWELVSCPIFPIPAHWPRIAGMDFGSGGDAHATACGWVAFDPETNRAYGYDAYKGNGTPPVHVAAIKSRGEHIPIAWPHDGNRSGNGYMTGSISISQANLYRASPLNLNLLRDHFKNDSTKDNDVETGITALSLAMEQGRFKWFSHLDAVRQEYEMYHRKDGKIVTKEDDLMASFRYAYQSKRYASTPQPREYDDRAVPGTNDYDPFQGSAA